MNELIITDANEIEITWMHGVTVKIKGQDMRGQLVSYIKHHGYPWDSLDNILHSAEWFRVRNNEVTVKACKKQNMVLRLIMKMFLFVWHRYGRLVDPRTSGMGDT